MNLDFSIIFMFLLISISLSMIISFVSFFLSEKSPNKEKLSVYECGFDPFHTPGEPFSMSFFIMGMLFLMFDLEISYLMPWACSTNSMSLNGQMIVLFFLLVLMLGLMYEWKSGGLEWE